MSESIFDGKYCRVVVGKMDEWVESILSKRSVVCVVDSALEEIWRGRFGGSVIAIEGGEGAKNLDVARHLWERLIELGATRQTLLLAVGGGTICDLVGFVASTYMRGIESVYIPTTLLAQVDAAIGGKCGINLGGYKNMVGSFHFPERVLCDVSLLSSLPEKEWRAGMAEVIKTAIVGDTELFDMLENTSLEEVRSDRELCTQIVSRCVAVKCGIVERDSHEKDERRLLNLGHTWGHAIESLSGDYSHGDAVAVGIAYVTRKAVEQGLLAEGDGARIVALLEHYGLPTEVPLSEEDLMRATTHDKKHKDGAVRWVMPTSIGHCIVV